MRIAEIEFRERVNPTPDQLTELRAAHVYGDEIRLCEEDSTYTWGHKIGQLTTSKCLVDLDLMPVGIPFHVIRIVAKLAGPAGDGPFNTKVGVMLPGLGLLQIDKVHLLSDSCTDVLKEHMEQGWRIVAVCPQPNQRRPDYILGRASEK